MFNNNKMTYVILIIERKKENDIKIINFVKINGQIHIF